MQIPIEPMGKDKITVKEYTEQGVESSLVAKHWGILMFWGLEKEESTEKVKKELKEVKGETRQCYP